MPPATRERVADDCAAGAESRATCAEPQMPARARLTSCRGAVDFCDGGTRAQDPAQPHHAALAREPHPRPRSSLAMVAGSSPASDSAVRLQSGRDSTSKYRLNKGGYGPCRFADSAVPENRASAPVGAPASLSGGIGGCEPAPIPPNGGRERWFHVIPGTNAPNFGFRSRLFATHPPRRDRHRLEYSRSSLCIQVLRNTSL